MTDALTPTQRADATLAAILETQWNRAPAVVLNSPPGAGKTGVAERLAVQGMALMKERVMLTTQTNEQAFDLARRLAKGFPRLTTHMMVSETLDLPTSVTAFGNIVICTSVGDLPTGPCMVVANAYKWSWLDAHQQLFDLQIVDEAYQLPDYRFQLIAGLAARQVLIGDPGQIEPVIQSELERWRCDPAGPHIAAPRALVERYPDTIQMSLPVSRRLVQDTISFVQPAFYPGMAFEALEPVRPIWFNVPGIVPVDAPMDAAAAGQSLVMVELPAMMAGETDPELAEEIVETVRRVVGRQAMIFGREGQPTAVTPAMIGIACAQVSQVNAIRERLGPDLSGVFVETANRFQGLERELMFVQHPLSGRADATGFHLDAGRLCVLLSRHRVACWIFGRAGIRRQLQRYAPMGERSLGIADDPEFEGWQANLHLMTALTQRNRVYAVPGRPGHRSLAG